MYGVGRGAPLSRLDRRPTRVPTRALWGGSILPSTRRALPDQPLWGGSVLPSPPTSRCGEALSWFYYSFGGVKMFHENGP